MVRVVDDSGEGYLFSGRLFIPIVAPAEAELSCLLNLSAGLECAFGGLA